MPVDDPVKMETYISQRKSKEQEWDSIRNSEQIHDCWFIENPNNKELTKNIKLKLGPNCE